MNFASQAIFAGKSNRKKLADFPISFDSYFNSSLFFNRRARKGQVQHRKGQKKIGAFAAQDVRRAEARS